MSLAYPSGGLYLNREFAKRGEECGLTSIEKCPLAYEVWGENPELGGSQPVMLAAYWDVREALRDASRRSEAACDCNVIVANGLSYNVEDGCYYFRKDVK